MDKKKIFSILVGIITFSLLTSCCYMRPTLSWRIFKDETQDSITKNIIKTKDYNYISFRKFAWLGGYSIDKEYDTKGKLVKQTQSKKTPVYMNDGHVRFFYKAKYFDSIKKIKQVDYRITQCKGVRGIRLVDKSVFFENGRKVKTIDKRDK